jgi:hypothetical protein
VAGMSCVLLDHVQEHGADSRGTTVRPGDRCRSLQSTLRDDLGHDLARALDSVSPHRVHIVHGIQRPGTPFPVRVRVKVHGVPRGSVLLAGELDRQPVRLHQGHVLDQATKGHGAGRRGRAQTLLV